MRRILLGALLAIFTVIDSCQAGGTSQAITVTSAEFAESGTVTLRFTQPDVGPRVLHIRYNQTRMRGVVSAKEHEAALAKLRLSIARSPKIRLGAIGGDFANLTGSDTEFASDALQLHEGVIYAWPTKR
jgi:hypothetical protein